MSFGGGGGFGGFGSSTNNNTFGGFGSNNNNNSGFGSNNTSSPFGQQSNTGGSLFGGGANNNNTSSPFGGGGGGFGSNNNTNTSFGSKPFGSGTTGNLFGGGNSGSTFGGFGSTTNNNNSGFGSNNTNSGGLFGQNKTGFGSTGTGTGAGGLFGGGNTSGGFGSNNTSGGFGSSSTTGFGGGNAGNQANNGTAGTPFSAFQEKDQSSAGGTQHYQTITFQQPYQNYSLEELRIVDYNQGRRYGNQNGQGGAFGQSTGFGGFGSNNNTTNTFGSNNNSGGGLFGGGNTNTTSSFGNQNNSNAFGSNNNNAGGGLFGQNKPGGLFGSTSTTQGNTGGSIFGGATANTTGGGFGSGGGGFGSSTTNTNTGGGLFGQQNQTQNKQAFGGFGSNTAASSSPFGGGGGTGTFGQSNANTGGGLFGQQNQASSAPAFGASQTTTSNTGGGLFGGASGGGGLFGQNNNQQNQQKPGGLFGGSTTATTGGGLFGQNNQNQSSGGLFGGATNNTTGGGLFGQNNQTQQQQGGLFGNSTGNTGGGGLFGNKPATTGSNPFGGSTQNTGSTGGGLFGGLNTQNNQSGGSSLFGQQNQQKPGGLFGGSTTNASGGGLFGGLGQNNTNNNASSNLGNSLFSSTNQQQNQQQSGNSLFGASGVLQTSINTNPYGNDNLFAGLATPTQSPGPLATPLSSSQKTRKSAVLPQHKLNPSASTRLLTPQNKRIGGGGFGFSYSTYGTPNSASSQSSPGYSSGFLGNSLTRSLGKSLSTSNLRNSFTPETSILAPGAFSTNNRSSAGGSLKRLNINRSINRVPLFDEPSPDKKRVTFEPNGSSNTLTNGTTGTEVMLHPDSERASGAATPSGSSSTVNGHAEHLTNGAPEMEEVNGTALTTVPENRTLSGRNQEPPSGKIADPKPGEYYSKPSMEQLRKMNKDQLSRVENFVVGRHQIGEIEFNPGHAVDLSGTELDKLFNDIVQLNTRNATVYGENTTVPKPAEGSGLNHFSRITLANSWPRNRVGKKDTKHLERLKRVSGTTFEDYRAATGEWVFTVPHFSSYGLDYDGDLYSSDEDDGTSPLSAVPDTPAQSGSARMSGTPQDNSPVSFTQSSPDDTFDFKKGKLLRASVPGGFGDEVPYEEEEDVDDTMESAGDSFLGERSVGSLDGQHDADYVEESESELVEDQDMADSFSGPVHTTEQSPARPAGLLKDSIKPKSILKNSQVLRPNLGTPSKAPMVFDDDWANQLQRTISPKKQDRHALRQSQGEVLRERDENSVKLNQSSKGLTIPTHMELLGGLWEDTDKAGSKRGGHGIQLPYTKRPKTSRDLDELSADDRDFHSCNKPHFNETGTLIYAAKGSSSLEDNLFPTVLDPIVGASTDIRVTKFPLFADAVTDALEVQRERTQIRTSDGPPHAKLSTDAAPLDFVELAKAVTIDTPASTHEQMVWELLSILFDEQDKPPTDMTPEAFEQYKDRLRKDRLSDFWQTAVFENSEKHAKMAETPEEKAIAYLSGHKVPEACHALLNGFDLRLATLVAQIGGDQVTRANMSTQIEEWRRLDVLSDMDDSVRALYELVSGNCAQSKGKIGGGRENKVTVLNIAQQFNLDWRRAFGLRLWYGILADEPIEMAVAQYADALRDGLEEVKPVPWFVEQDVPSLWNDKDAENREDILWGILKLYASSKLELSANIEDVLAPENVSGHPLNARLSFQLFQLFKSRQDDEQEWTERRVSMPTDRHGEGVRSSSFMSSIASVNERDTQATDPLTELGDQLTLTYAASLHSAEHWTTAIFIYCHLSSASMRECYIRSLLNQYSATYSVAETDPTYKYLVEDLKLSPQWIHAAAALEAKIGGDGVRQASHLIKAGELEEAHEVVCRTVGPESIISRDYDALRELLGEFVPTPPSSPMDETMSISTRGRGRTSQKNEPVQGWARGGQIYFDYIHLLDLTSNQSSYRVDEDLNAEIRALLAKLHRSLEFVARDRWEGCGLEERVALTEIGGVVAGLIAKNQPSERARILKLPLTEDMWLKHSTELSISYYRNVISSATGT